MARKESRSRYLLLLERLLTPAVRFCFKRSLFIHDFMDVAKRVFIKLAEEEMRRSTDKINVSRLSVMTGLYRQDVKRILDQEDAGPDQRASLLSRVLGQWEQDKRYRSKKGEPRPLNLEGEDNEFYNLVRAVSTTINPATVLFELERMKRVKRVGKCLKLIDSDEDMTIDEEKLFELLARDLETLLRAVEDNFRTTDALGNLHIRTEYDNIYREDLPAIRSWLVEQGKEFHRRARQFIATFDKDVNPRANISAEAGGKVVVTAFSYTEPPVWDLKNGT